MSRYVRTKDRVFELSGAWGFFDVVNNKKAYETIQPPHFLEETDIIKEADTIKDLCDGFYIDYKPAFDQIGICKGFEYFKNQWYHFEKKPNAYGFIKTDKGFIYVAKLNEQGELILL